MSDNDLPTALGNLALETAAEADSHTPANPTVPYYSPNIQQAFGSETQPSPLPEAGQAYADIGYAFDEAKYLARSEARLRAGGLPTELPPGWPQALEGPLVWTSSDFPDEDVYIYHLTDQDKAEINDALAHFKTLNKTGRHVNKESFPLPTLGEKLLRIKDDVYEGRGFAVLRGLDVDAYGKVDLVTVYLGLTSYVAEVRGKQNQQGEMLIHVVNTSETIQHENATTNMPYHTDLVCDVVATLTKSCGASGGTPALASVFTVYNELAATRPDLIHVLAEPNWPFDTYHRDPPFYYRALLYHLSNGRIALQFSRRTLVGHAATSPDPTGAARSPGIPGLTEAQAEALDALHAIGLKHEVKVPMQRGDIRFVNNLALMHRRDKYEDGGDDDDVGDGDGGGRRHLMRLWLHNPEACWPLPPALKLAWERVFADQEREERWELLVVEEGTGRLCVKRIWKEGDDDDGEGQEGLCSGENLEPACAAAHPVTACD
ncbi:hypothetical protein VTJ49DRAFT_4852 [Mycothermus thermophilus]|uniref:TauD/TfdA-like domain-containing protein n=1 Tax=Humicola insolens TaxID=85995 RepID=A0ABR3VL92_HUMIN